MNIGNSSVGVEEFTVDIETRGDQPIVRVDGAEYPFAVPFTRDYVESALEFGPSSRASTQTSLLSSLGSTLFSSLFSGELGRAYWRRMADVERQDGVLRLRILSSAERTQHLPWELMFDPSRGDFMALSGRIALVRTRLENYKHDGRSQQPPLSRLRVLVAEADTTGGGMRTEEDIATLTEISNRSSGLMDLTVLRETDAKSLERALSSSEFDVFHFAGSGDVLPYVSSRGSVKQGLRLLGPTKAGVLLDRRDLGKMLQKANVRLAVLNACRSDWIARSVARYIPAVIGLREDAQVESCLSLCQSLYASLVTSRMPLDLAVTSARQAMNLSAKPGIADWCKLIVYLQQTDGTFLAPAERATSQATAPPASKEKAKLARLLGVHMANLNAITNGTGVFPSDVSKEYADDLLQKIDGIKRQLTEGT